MSGPRPRLICGPKALEEVAAARGSDLVLTSVVGAAGLVPTLRAIRAGKDIALANKESLVCAGPALLAMSAGRRGITIITANERDFGRLAQFHPFHWQVPLA